MALNRMFAYPDSKCCWGYMVICDKCFAKAPAHVDRTRPIKNPPAVNKSTICEICGEGGLLETA